MVKISEYRGNFESFLCENYKALELDIDDMTKELGIYKKITEFIVEDAINDVVELGTDLYTVDGKYPSKFLAGIEVKDRGYVGSFKDYSFWPKPLMEINEKLSPILKNCGARCNFSTEVRIGKDHIPYPVDYTARMAAPPGEIMMELYTNLAEIYWKGANGIMVDPIPSGLFACEVIIQSENMGSAMPQQIDIPKELDKFVKLHNACKMDGSYYITPINGCRFSQIGGIVGIGNTMEEAHKKAAEIAKEVKGHSLEIKADEVFEDVKKELEKAEKMGLPMM